MRETISCKCKPTAYRTFYINSSLHLVPKYMNNRKQLSTLNCELWGTAQAKDKYLSDWSKRVIWLNIFPLKLETIPVIFLRDILKFLKRLTSCKTNSWRNPDFNCRPIRHRYVSHVENSVNTSGQSFSAGQFHNSWFSADVIRLYKLGFSHVGAHARCEVISKSMPFLSVHDQSLRIISRAFRRKRPRYKFGFIFFWFCFLRSVTKRSSTTAHAWSISVCVEP